MIDAADARTRDRLLAGLLASLALVGVVAYLQGRAIVRNLRRFATAARGIAQGNLHERVPVRGRDEFAELGAALNDMAVQLEARLAELEAERARVREALTRFGEALAATHDVQELLRIVAAAAAEATSARGSRIVSADGSVVASGDADGEGERLILPLTASGERFGTLELVGDSFSKEQRMNGASLAAHAVVAFVNARLHGMVERQALVDGLTGLANRRAASDAVHAEVARAERLETPLAVVLADLDGFKDVNDAHGHAVGDAVLRTFAEVLRETLRESDVAGRWGGEEFLLLLPGADEDGAAQLAERVRVALAARSIPGVPGLRVTASFGVAEYAGETNTDQLIAAADGALYRAKRRRQESSRACAGSCLLTLSNRKTSAIPVIMRADDEHDPREERLMPVETPSIFAQVIKEHLDLKERNARLGGSMPIEHYKEDGDPFENHPLFKSEEQARIEETMDGVDPDFSDASLEDVGVWPGEEPLEEVTAETSEATVPAIEESAFWGNGGARDFDWGD